MLLLKIAHLYPLYNTGFPTIQRKTHITFVLKLNLLTLSLKRSQQKWYIESRTYASEIPSRSIAACGVDK